MRTIDQQSIRKQNIERIWEMLTTRRDLTRQELAEGTGLSPMSISNLVDHLKRFHVLQFATPERPVGDGRRATGRKAERISLCTTRHAWIMLDLTKIHFHFQALALDLSCVLQGAPWPYDRQRDFSLNLRGFLREARAAIDRELKGREILGVAVVAPGPYDVTSDTVVNQRIPELNALPIKALLREELGLYDYYVDEDVKFAVRAHMQLATQGDGAVLYYAYIGEGVGGATLHNGNVLRGLNAAAGDVGQLPDRDGSNFEGKLSLRVFAQACGLEVQPLDNEDMLLASLSRCMREDFPRYQRELLRSADTVGAMLFPVVWLLDPSYIVVDCRYAAPYQDLFIDRARRRLSGLLGETMRRQPAILAAPYETRSVLLGAAQVLSREWIGRIA